ncbi:DUF7544 domain-containing protein [Halorubrum trapanicum]|uniref:DUF7544 domain-containing protein n=1 Tax=Halorubrum trapanicum TaxID=29284 RepID=UPI003C7008DD
MTWHAVAAIDRAVDATRRFLFPFEAVRWAKLAFLALVMAGASGAGTSSFGVSTGRSDPWAEIPPPEAAMAPGELGSVVGSVAERVAGLDAALLAGGALAVLLVVVALAVCSTVLRLVFYDTLATTEVALRRPFLDRFGQGVGLFAFAAALAVATGIPALGVAVAVDPAVFRVLGVSVGGSGGLSAAATAALGAVGVALALVGTVASGLTFEFVAPAMIARNVGVIAGWREVLASLRGSAGDVAVYLVIHAVIAAGVGVVQALAVAFVGGLAVAASLVALLLAAVPLGGVEALVGTTSGMIAVALVLIVAALVVVLATLPFRLVARTYLTAYEVSTLAGIDPDLAPLDPTLVPPDTAPGAGDASNTAPGAGDASDGPDE